MTKLTAADMEDTGDFVRLKSQSEYAQYFNKVGRAFELLLAWYGRLVDEGTENQEAKVIKGFLKKLHATIQILSARETFSPTRDLRLDLNESGYPHTMGFIGLETDLRDSEDRLRQFPPSVHLKETALDHIFRAKEDPTEILWKLAEREYLKSLEEDNLFFVFTPGELILRSESEKLRHYTYSWGCFDWKTSMPFVHVMAFDQDENAEPLHTPASLSFMKFMEVVKAEGSRAPTCLVLATEIDKALPAIHPKVLKRTRLGPILMPEFSKESHDLLELLRKHGNPEDFIFLLKNEMIFSGRQEVKKGGLLSARQVREIFVIPSDDLDCYELQTSQVYRHMLAPHQVVQHLEVLQSDEGKKLKDYKIVTYDGKGVLYGI